MNTYPLTTNHFQVEWGGTRMGFTEVSGLSIGIEPINYHEGSSKENSTQKMPGRLKYDNVILKRGIVMSDNEFYTWMSTIKLNKIERRDLTISLLNEDHEPVMVWRLKNAFPIRIEWSPLRADANEAAIESIEISHEGMTVRND
ncbi:phage tail protein [Cryomorpha ignava]|uniref:Phage tail protein n=1 Tax=Cryomorpha ignava TaxID=101383 RepID=A0A7K3WMW5_9FLAO|nr:phage tail protein [Cryomorpha ignava]NEN22341.1 phage tail protein [Cryomorpha ignava]